LGAGAGTTRLLKHTVLLISDSDVAVGHGECVAVPGAMGGLEVLAGGLLERDPMDREPILWSLRPQLVSGFLISALSTALDDLVARRLGVPIHALYGGSVRTRVRPYAASYGSVEGDTLGSWLREAESLAARGCTAMKLRLGVLPVLEECRALGAFRAQVPASFDLVADGNGGFNTTTARVMGRCAAWLGLLWFEEPLQPLEYRGFPELAADLDVPLAGGEMVQNMDQAFDLLSRGGVDVIQPDPLICGGIGATIEIGRLARLFGRIAVPHTSGAAMGVAAGLHAMAALPNQSKLGQNDLFLLEYPSLVSPVQAAVAPGLLRPVDGWIDVPTTPGWGFDIDDDAVRRLASASFDVH
jgi:D-galactarolactone cycloisomerase